MSLLRIPENLSTGKAKRESEMSREKFHNHYGESQSEAAAFPPLVHPQETSVHLGSPSSFRSFVTSGCKKDVLFNGSVYETIDRRDDAKRLQSFNDCRSSAWFVRHRVTRKVRVASSRCGLRWCPLCIKTKRFIMVQSIVPWLKAAKKPKFVTLTLKHSDAPLSFQIDSLYEAFKKLRRRPWIKKRLTGGVWFFQVKKSDNDGRWHPHLHLLTDGRFIEHERICQIWKEVTHGSSVVDLKAVKDPKKAAEYVARYASAPCRLSDLSESDAVEVVDSLHGRRICGTWGNGRDIKLAPSKCPDAEDWEFLESFTAVIFKRRSSDYHKMIYESYVKDTVCYCDKGPPPPEFEGWGKLLREEPLTFEQLKFQWEC